MNKQDSTQDVKDILELCNPGASMTKTAAREAARDMAKTTRELATMQGRRQAMLDTGVYLGAAFELSHTVMPMYEEIKNDIGDLGDRKPGDLVAHLWLAKTLSNLMDEIKKGEE